MKKISITTEFTAEVPDSMTEEEIAGITLDLAPEKIKICGDNGPIPEARITSYTTGECQEN